MVISFDLVTWFGRLGGFCLVASRALLIKKEVVPLNTMSCLCCVCISDTCWSPAQVDKWLSTVVPLKVPIYWKGKPQNKCPMYPSCVAAAAPCEAGWVVPPIAHDCTRFESNNACWSGERRQSDFLETEAERERERFLLLGHTNEINLTNPIALLHCNFLRRAAQEGKRLMSFPDGLHQSYTFIFKAPSVCSPLLTSIVTYRIIIAITFMGNYK